MAARTLVPRPQGRVRHRRHGLGGTLGILPTGRLPFADLYERYGLLAHAGYGNLDFQAEQWYGDDHDADGLLTNQHSSGGYVRLKYYPIPHAYFGLRYDAYANPYINRDFVYYAPCRSRRAASCCKRFSRRASIRTSAARYTIAFRRPLKN